MAKWRFIVSDLKCVGRYGGQGNGGFSGAGYGDARTLIFPSIRAMLRDPGDGAGAPEYSSYGYPSPSIYESIVVPGESP
jgi:hypothetical protein